MLYYKTVGRQTEFADPKQIHKRPPIKRYGTKKNNNIRPVGQAVKTPPSHGGIMGSSPVRVTSKKDRIKSCLFLLYGDTARIDLNPSGSENHVRDFL